MVPIQVILLLLVVNLPDMIGASDWPRLSAAVGFWSFALMQAALLLSVFYRAKSALAAMHNPSASALAVAGRMDQVFSKARWSTVLITAIHLLATGAPDAVIHFCDGIPGLNNSPLPEILFMLPAVICWLMLWIMAYFIESEARERSFPFRLSQALPAHVMPTLWQYLSMQVRHNFYILVPVVLHAMIVLTGEFLARWVPYADVVAVPLGILVVLLMMPWLLIKIWSTVPLSGPLRRKLDSVAEVYRLRFRNILLWKTHNGVTNAAILGWVPFARYFLMTDELVETLSDRQLEAVFAHEVGHGVHRHLWWYLAAFFGGSFLATGLAVAWTSFMPAHLANFAGENTASVLGMVLLMGMLTLGFPLISHRFEHQADWFACRHMARSVQPGEMTPRRVHGSLETLNVGPADQVSLEEYKSGQYRNAPLPPVPGAPGPALPVVALDNADAAANPGDYPSGGGAGDWHSLAALLTSPPPPDAAGPPPLTNSQAGAEVFISALDTIMETSHRSRNRRGWMHPSINHRERLLRLLARNPDAASGFNRKMVRTRWWIAGFCAAGLIIGGIPLWNEVMHPEMESPATAPAAATRAIVATQP